MCIWISILSIVFHGLSVHDMHISKSKIKYDEVEETFQVSVHIFIDDLEAVIHDQTELDLRMFSDFEHQDADSLVEAYLNEQLLIAVNGKRYWADWIGKEMSEDLEAAWCYLEIPFDDPMRSIEVDNNILQDKFDDQTNVVILELPNRKKDHILFPKSRHGHRIEL